MLLIGYQKQQEYLLLYHIETVSLHLCKNITFLVNSQKVCLDEINNFPERYIMLGDSVAHFTPVYAQGMTFASLCTEELFSLIVESDGNFLGLSKKYNKSIKKHVDLCW